MILSYLSYCLTIWAQASNTTLKLVQSVYHRALEVLENKPKASHCHCLRSQTLMSWVNLIKISDDGLAYKVWFKFCVPLSFFKMFCMYLLDAMVLN